MSFNPIAKFVHGEPTAVDYTPGSAVSAGAVVIINGKPGIAIRDIAAGQLGALAFDAIWDIVNDGSAFSDRQDVYWNATAQQCTVNSEGNTYLGWAIGAVSSSTAGTTTTRVAVGMPSSPSITPVQNIIPDPGNAGAINVSQSGVCQITTAGAETRTIAAPTAAGIVITLNGKTLVGTATVNSAVAINTAGNTHMPLTTAGQSIQLQSVASGGSFRWAVVYNDGLTLS